MKVRVGDDDEITIERIERALVTTAYIVVRHGAVYAPLLDRLEREFEECRRQLEPVERARRILERPTEEADDDVPIYLRCRFQV